MPTQCDSSAGITPRPLLRFGLRSLLVLMVVVSSFFGWVAFEISRGRDIEQAIHDMHLQTFSYRSKVPSC